MDWSSAAPFGIFKQRLEWLGQRQQVLARNIANADTPGYIPSDLKPFETGTALARKVPAVRLAATTPNHLGGTIAPPQAWAEQRTKDAVEATPNGNAVDLEEQMAKLGEVGAAHKLATQLYRKYTGMVRTAAGARD
ncbi:MAG: flagellar basal body protein [Rhodospirillales bacterium]